ncbi:MAG: 2-aminoethylphosphonate-pyruvate transaminase [bacterium]|jgi:2-aminoethylphosphonate-pyruvate transaminase
MMKRVSLTPAIFHLSDKVNAVAPEYAKNPIVPRGPELKPLLDRIRSKTVKALDAEEDYEAVIFTSAGSGAIAAAVGSCATADKGILVISNGAYGERQAAFAEQCGIRAVVYELEYGEKPSATKIEQMILEYEVGTIGMVHGGTSTCSMNPVEEVGAIAKRRGLRFIVDCISTVFVEELKAKDWGIDVVIGSANKGLHANPDLSFVLVSKDLLKELKGTKGKVPYLDVIETWKKQKSGGHPYTINPRALLEMEAALDDLNERGGLSGRIEMYQERTRVLREGYQKLGLKLLEKDNMPLQNIGTAIYLPEDVNFDELAEILNTEENEAGETFQIYSAQGKLSSTVFRVFNMGEYSIESYKRFLVALEKAFKKIQS